MPTGLMIPDASPPPRRPDAKPEKPAPEKPQLASWLTGDAPATLPQAVTPAEQIASIPPVQTEITVGTDRAAAYQMLEQANKDKIATEELVQQERDDARSLAEKTLGLNDPKNNKVYRMTDEEYLALSPKQRAAIDFNTALVSAVRQDKRNQEKYGRSIDANGMVSISGESAVAEEQRAQYEADLESIFGKDRGSDYYAPATVALLKDIGYANANGDLDEFLNLKVAITDKDLKNFNAEYGTGTREYTMSGVPGVQTEESEGYVLDGKIVDSPKFSLQNQLVRSTQARLDELLAKGDQLLGGTFQTLAQARSGQVQEYGGTVPQLNTAGYLAGNPNTERFQAVFEELGANKANTSVQSLSALSEMWRQNGINPDDFWSYANSRIDQAALEGGTLGSVGYQPDEMRKLLGLEPKGR